MIVIELNSLRNGLPTLTSAWGSFLSEAGQYCLTRAAHQSGTILKLINDDKIIQLIWDNQLDNRSEYSYGDDEEATEYGAICISILLAIKLTEFNTVIRTYKGSGFD